MVAGAWLLLLLLGAALTALLVRRIWKMRSTATFAANACSAAAVGAALLGAGGHVYGVLSSLRAVSTENAEASAKARALAEGISVAMNCAAVSFIIWVPAILVAFRLLRTSKPPQ